jgi:hypothetical protein
MNGFAKTFKEPWFDIALAPQDGTIVLVRTGASKNVHLAKWDKIENAWVHTIHRDITRRHRITPQPIAFCFIPDVPGVPDASNA